MPLILSVAQIEFEKLIDKNSTAFAGFPTDINQVAENWSNVLFNYAGAVIPASTTAVTAKNAMKTILLGSVAPGSFFPLLISGYTAFAAGLAAGMVTGGSGVAPVVPINFAPLLALPLDANSTPQIISLFASITDAWFRTGTFIPTAGGVINWN